LFAPGLVGDFHFGFVALIDRRGVAVEFGIYFCRRHILALAHEVGRRVQGRVHRVVFGFEHDIGFERLAHMRLQVERGKLQQSDGLLQLRRHGQLLADAKLQTWLQHSSFKSKPTV